ncbi:MAG: SusC/RagA family TonB-linked outer membrane protein [Cyclobacteriaceae bacterium]
MRYNYTGTPTSVFKRPKLCLKSLGWLFIALILTSQAWAQQTISGKVTSTEDGSTLPGVNVIVKGTSQGTVTDIDGNYRLSVPEDAEILSFSFIGLEAQDVEFNGRSIINLEMASDTRQLSEVVVTAIGIEREKKALGYAVSDVEGEAIQQISEPDAIRGLTGKIPGVNIQGSGGGVGSATNITIRGNSSLLGNNQPLFVVDGIPFDNSTTASNDGFEQGNPQSNRALDLDPNLIESITVLKGASAAALYGSRAANGVIVVTTKAGKAGSKKGFEVTLNSGFSVEQVAMNPEYQGVWTQGATFGSNNFVFNNGFFGTWGPRYSDVNRWLENGVGDNGDPFSVLPPLRKYNNPKNDLFAADIYPEIGEVPTQVLPNTDNWENFWEDGILFENSVTVNAGGEKTSLTAGISRTDNEGIIPFSELDRTSVSFGGRAQLDNGIFINGSVTYVETNQRTAQQGAEIFAAGDPGSSLISMLYLMSPTYDLTNNPYFNPRTGGSIYYRNGFDNPYWVAEFAPLNSEVSRAFGKAQFGYDITDWLTVSYQAGFNTYTDRRSSLVPALGENIPAGAYNVDDIFREELDGTLLITLDKQVTTDFNIRAILGHNVNQRTFEQQTIEGLGIIDRTISNIQNTSAQVIRRDIFEQQRFQAVFGDLSFSYRDFAFLNVVARNDWSSTLPADERSYFYPGASASFVASEVFNMPSFWDYFKVRGGISRVGNEANPYLTQNTFRINDNIGFTNLNAQFPFNGTNSVNANRRKAEPALSPEFTTEYEVGTEMRFFSNRIGIDFTYYDRRSTDQIVTIDVPASTGFGTRVTNLGEVQNRGIEIGLDVTPIALPSGFTWNIFAAYTRNRNEILDLGDLEQVIVDGTTTLAIAHRPGFPAGVIIGEDWLRYNEATGEVGNVGVPLVNPLSGKPVINPDVQVIGDPNPDYILGITNTLSFKGITLSALIDYHAGGDMWSLAADQMRSRGVLNEPILNDRTPILPEPGILGNVNGPILDGAGGIQPTNVILPRNDFFFFNGWAAGGADWASVYDRTTIRLREVTLGYTLPASLLEKLPFGSASVRFSGRNLWFNAPNFPDALNMDPEVSGLGVINGPSQGLELMGVPTTRRYGVNISLTF